MHQEILESKTDLIFELLSKSKLVAKFYLAGGTALALQFGHRKSIDLDFFCDKNFSNILLKKKLSKMGKLKVVSEDEGTLHVVLNGVKISFLYYPYKLIYKELSVNNIRIADWRDIAAMKISAISSRGSRKDFVDMYFILKRITLVELFGIFEKKYKGISYNKIHLLKSMVFFEDADKEPSPIMMNIVSWRTIKQKIESAQKESLGFIKK